MGIAFILIAGCFTALSNFCMRRSIDSGGTSKAFLMVQLSFAALTAVLIGPIRTFDFHINGPIVVLGMGSGLVLGLMLLTLGRALEQGPAGLTFAALNAATVMPAIVMATLFGAAFGFIYTPWHALGSILVLAGLFWAGRGASGWQDKRLWLSLAALTFSCHLLFMILMQWRALMLNRADAPMAFSAQEMASQWFMPLIYFAAALLQIGVYVSSEKKWPNREECVYGLFGGIANGASTFFLIWATEVASAMENAVMFPLFSVSVILICNIWSQRLYQEKVNWKACHVCILGLFIGTIDWAALFK